MNLLLTQFFPFLLQRTPDEKIQHLCRHNITSELRAVQNRAYISVPFSGSTMGVRIGSLAYNLAEAIVALGRNQPLPSIEFSSIALDNSAGGGSQAITSSGVKVYTRLPVFNGTDLEVTCAKEANTVEIRDVIEVASDQSQVFQQGEANEDASLSTGWTAFIVVLSLTAVAASVSLAYIIQ